MPLVQGAEENQGKEKHLQRLFVFGLCHAGADLLERLDRLIGEQGRLDAQ